MEEEIDLGKYLAILIRRWWVVIGVTLACALVTGVLAISRPKVYKAHAFIAVAQPTWQVSLDTAITAPSESAASATDLKRRLASLVTLVTSPSVAEAVLKSLGDKLPASERSVQALMSMVKGELVKDSDLIDITITHGDPDMAVAIANAWAEGYMRLANSLYGFASQDAYAVVHEQVQAAKAGYEESQAILEKALAQSRSDELRSHIGTYQATIEAFYEARGVLVPALLSEIGRLQSLRENALMMRTQVQAGGQAAAESNGPALLLLKAQAFAATWQEASSWRLPIQPSGWMTSTVSPLTLFQTAPPALQIQSTPLTVTADAMIVDLNALAAMLERRQNALKEELRSLSEALARGEESAFFIGPPSSEGSDQGEIVDANSQLATTIRDLEQRVRELSAQLAQEESRLKQAQAQRDLAWQVYDTLRRKEAELAVAAELADSQVRLVAPAAVAQGSADGTKTIATGIVGGLVLGIVAAYLLESWQSHRTRSGAQNAGS